MGVISMGRLGRLRKNGTRRVRMTYTTRVWVARDSTNQPLRNSLWLAWRTRCDVQRDRRQGKLHQHRLHDRPARRDHQAATHPRPAASRWRSWPPRLTRHAARPPIRRDPAGRETCAGARSLGALCCLCGAGIHRLGSSGGITTSPSRRSKVKSPTMRPTGRRVTSSRREGQHRTQDPRARP